jgi:hypothetical protein
VRFATLIIFSRQRMDVEFNIGNVTVIYVSSIWQKRALYRIIAPAFAKPRFCLSGVATHYFSNRIWRIENK